jgi:hypothetical protein
MENIGKMDLKIVLGGVVNLNWKADSFLKIAELL